MRSITPLFLLLLAWSAAPSPLILLAGAYLVGMAWLVFEAWRAPVIENI
jgi:hypothetical protein